LGITLQVSRLPAIEEDGRFFEGYRDEAEGRRYLELLNFTVLSLKQDVTKKNTHSKKTISELDWCDRPSARQSCLSDAAGVS